MRARFAGLLAALSLVACSAVTAIVADKPYDPLPIPVATPVLDLTMRIFVIGDAGEQGVIHDADWNAMKAYLSKGGSVPAVLLIPGDVSYPKGLPDQCSDAWNVLQEEYLKPTPAGMPIYSVPGNHDHGDKDFGTNFDIAWRAAYFDCEQQERVGPQIGWAVKACPCDKRWHVPTGAGTIAATTLLPATAARKGLTLVTYDSQAAIESPEPIARDLERVLDSAAPDQRLIVMAHHPLVSVGQHGTSSSNPQDLGNAKYKAYIDRFSTALATRGDRVALTIFGHDHSIQYFPRFPPELISGAGAKKSSVSTPPDDAFAKGSTPGLAVLEFHATGAITVQLISQDEPRKFEISPVP